jgi:hypothetical protein
MSLNDTYCKHFPLNLYFKFAFYSVIYLWTGIFFVHLHHHYFVIFVINDLPSNFLYILVYIHTIPNGIRGCISATKLSKIATYTKNIFVPPPTVNIHDSRIGCRSQWPRGLRHELSSPLPTLRSWVRIPLEAWTLVCVLCLSRVEACNNTSTVIPASRKRRWKGNPLVSDDTVPADLRER